MEAIIKFEDQEGISITTTGPYESFAIAGRWLKNCGFLPSEGPANEWTHKGPFRIRFQFDSTEFSVKAIRATILPLRPANTMIIQAN